MEDSYTVHRRRKAAARRREKTPEPRLGADTTSPGDSMDEEEERRARMERMVEDTERMERMLSAERERSRPRQGEPEEPARRSRSPTINRAEVKEEEARTARKPVEPPRKLESPVRIVVPEASSIPSESGGLRRRMTSSPSRSPRHLSPASQFMEHSGRRRSSSRQRYEEPSDEDEDEDSPPTQHHRPRRSPCRPVKKQIIPLSDDCLIDDVARAKRAYVHREPSDEYEYEGEDDDDELVLPKRRRDVTVRRRKTSVMHTDREKEEIRKSVKQPSSWFSWIPFFGRRQRVDELIENNDGRRKTKEKLDRDAPVRKNLDKNPVTIKEPDSDKTTLREFFGAIGDVTAELKEYCRQNPREMQILIELRNLCIIETIVTLVICGIGGLAFRFTEGAFESFYKCGVKRVKRDFLDSLWSSSHNLKEDDWKSLARRKLMDFEEQLHVAHEAGVQTYSGQRSWSFLNSMVYCLTVITTIGYGHISPSTTTGRALTIIYAIFGIPMFLIVLADFGKLFTRGIKFLWAFVRRLYYTGSCRKVRRTVPMQEMMKGVQMVYDLATFRRPSQMTPEELVEIQRQQQQQQTVLSLDGNAPQQPDSPSTPAMSAFEIDDEFNLPISVAITILIVYIFIGATIFNIFEDWTFFESFYFVFISMSTIGFGDFVPQEPLYMMLSIVYLIFGLALTSMCINVVQVMLADQFKQASQKIGQSIGFHVSEEDGSLKPEPPEPVEVAEVHNPTTTSSSLADGKVAPKAKLEDADI